MTRPNLPWPSRAKLENEDPNLFLGLGPSFGALSAERRQAFFVAARRAHCRLVERDASFRAPPDEVSGFDATAWRKALRERARNPRKRSQESRDKDAASHAAARDRKKAVAAERDGHLKRLGHLVDPVWPQRCWTDVAFRRYPPRRSRHVTERARLYPRELAGFGSQRCRWRR